MSVQSLKPTQDDWPDWANWRLPIPGDRFVYFTRYPTLKEKQAFTRCYCKNGETLKIERRPA